MVVMVMMVVVVMVVMPVVARMGRGGQRGRCDGQAESECRNQFLHDPAPVQGVRSTRPRE